MKSIYSSLALLGFAATTVLADGASIIAALTKIGKGAATLNTTVVNWDGSLLGALPILGDSATLIGDIDDGTRVAQKSANLTDTEAINVYTAVTSLSQSVNITLTSIIKAQPEFKKILLTGLVKGDLQLTKKETDKFAAAVVSKVSTGLQSIALGVVATIDNSFNKAIAAYS